MSQTIERHVGGWRAADFSEHVRDRASDYYSEFAASEVRVELLNEWRRNNSRLFRFELTGDDVQRRLYVKAPTSRGNARSGDRPYLIPETDPAMKCRLHYEALSVIHETFQRVNDPRFGSVRILELLPESDVFVMDEAPGRTIRELLTKSSRLRLGAGASRLEPAFHNIGAWLRIYHAISDIDGEVIHDRREDLLDNFTRFHAYLAKSVDDQRFFQELAEDFHARVEAVIPEQLPLGLRFGDYGLTNILVSSDSRITAIDTLARWRAPIYEDIAWFLTGLKAYNVQVFSQGLAFNSKRIREFEREFLNGYFGRETIPANPIRLFEILRLLERWSAKVARNKQRAAVVGDLSFALVNRFFRKKISDVLALIERAHDQGDSK